MCLISHSVKKKTAGIDYVPINTTVSFPPNDTQAKLSLTIIDDDVVENYEFFNVQASLNGALYNSLPIIIEDSDSKYTLSTSRQCIIILACKWDTVPILMGE